MWVPCELAIASRSVPAHPPNAAPTMFSFGAYEDARDDAHPVAMAALRLSTEQSYQRDRS